jgi:diguanylate cyclase (GGDEF)-like protein
MKRTVRRWMHALVAMPESGPERRDAITRRAVLALVFCLLLAEAAVTFQYSGATGLIMMAATAGLGAFVYRGLEAIRPRSDRDDADSALVDSQTGLPTRVHLLDSLQRDIARCERYSHAVTLSVIRISQFEDIKTAWGGSTAQAAVDQVAETLKRITRASDFLCRLDESSFAVVLLQCSSRQASLYGDRVSLAVSNRPLKSESNVKVPLYVGVDVSALEYDSARFRGPLEFLSMAGGDLVPGRSVRSASGAGQRVAGAGDRRGFREELVRDYYPGGEIKDFADAYREARNRNRHAG